MTPRPVAPHRPQVLLARTWAALAVMLVGADVWAATDAHLVVTAELMSDAEDSRADSDAVLTTTREAASEFVGVRVEWATDAAFAVERCGASSGCRIDKLREHGARYGIDVVVDVRTRPWVFTVQAIDAEKSAVEDDLVEVAEATEGDLPKLIEKTIFELSKRLGLVRGGSLTVRVPKGTNALELSAQSPSGQSFVLQPSKPARVPAGTYTVTATDEAARGEAIVEVPIGANVDLTVDLVRVEPAETPWLWLAIGGAALVVGGIVIGVIAASNPDRPGTARLCQAPDRAQCE